MKTTDTSEKGLESLIVAQLTGQAPVAVPLDNSVGHAAAAYTIAGYVPGDAADYNRDLALDVVKETLNKSSID